MATWAPTCGYGPCKAADAARMSVAGGQMVSALRALVPNAALPGYPSQMGLSAMSSLVGGAEGVAEQAFSSWSGLSSMQLSAIQDLGVKSVFLIGNGNWHDSVTALSGTLLSIAGSFAKEIGKDVAGAIPIAGAIISAVVDFVSWLVKLFVPVNPLLTAHEDEVHRAALCQALIGAPGPFEPQGSAPDGSLMPCDMFNSLGAPPPGSVNVPPFYMPSVGLGLIAATELNPLMPHSMRNTFTAMRRQVQASLSTGLIAVRGMDPLTGAAVPPLPGKTTDGGSSLWPLYMDAVTWQRRIGTITPDKTLPAVQALYAKAGVRGVGQDYDGLLNCAPETTALVGRMIDNWEAQAAGAAGGAGYAQFAQQPFTPQELLAMRVASAAAAGKAAGIDYAPILRNETVALAAPGKPALSFPSSLASSAPGKTGGPGTLLVFALSAAAAWGGFRAARHYGLGRL